MMDAAMDVQFYKTSSHNLLAPSSRFLTAGSMFNEHMTTTYSFYPFIDRDLKMPRSMVLDVAYMALALVGRATKPDGT